MNGPRIFSSVGLLGLVTLCACASGQVGSDDGGNTQGSNSTAQTTGDTDDGSSGGDGDEEPGDEGSGDGGSGDGDDGDGGGNSTGDDGGMIKLDVFSGDEDGEATAEGGDDSGCEKVDLILSIDASSSMQAELDSIYATFLEVKAILASEVGEGIEDFHVGVMNACNNPPYLHNWAAGHTDCQFPANQNWLASDDPMLDQRFDCVIDIPFQNEALLGNGGDNGGYDGTPDLCEDGPDEDEQPALAAAAAVQPGVLENAGMVRDDAILFVVAITDEDEALADVADAQKIHDLYMQAKDPGEVVFLGIGGTDCPSAYDGGNVDDSKELMAVAAAFGDYGLFRTMCAGQSDDPIRDAFQEALTTIVDQACDEFEPRK